MENTTLEMLEFNKILDILAGYASFSVSRDLIRELRPSYSREVVRMRLKQSAEARRLLSLRPNFSIGQVIDIREDVKTAAKGKTLEPLTLLQIKETMAACRNVRNNLKKLGMELPEVWQVAQNMKEFHELEKDIEQCVDTSGEVQDAASPLLGSLRQQLRENRQRLILKLESIVKSRSGQKFAQEAYITERDNRYVIPVKAEFKKDIRGIIHDISNTGNTVFMEPLEVVEQGNELRQMSLEEKQEIWRILSGLSQKIGERESEISSSLEVLAEIDLLLAKARYAEEINAVEPRLSQDDVSGDAVAAGQYNQVRLVKARHPLLKGKAIPLDVEIGRDYRILVITGPNAGGKTVALKTIGLLALMTQAGIPIPASENSLMPVFNGIYSDIGDQQSIEQTLSTFSWHISNISNIMRKSTRDSLILLDELGISTDPEEGSALARAILLDLLEKGSLAVSTTHYNDLKAFAHVTQGMQNASMDFDSVTLIPTYRLNTGIPGRSNAISVAERMGLSSHIIQRAQGMLSSGSHEIEMLLNDLLKEKHEYEKMIQDLQRDKEELGKLAQKLRQDEAALAQREHRLLNDIGDTLMQETAKLQLAIREAEAELKKAHRRDSIERAKKLSVRMQAEIDAKTEQARSLLVQDLPHARVKAGLGDIVRMRNRNIEGVLVSLDEKNHQVEVRVGNTKLQLDMDEIEEVVRLPEESISQYPQLRKRGHKGSVPSLELDLRGRRSDE
ncbi:MAG TPA: endonuclease MutS2, partial [Dehalococcoidia bacterium]|nr:endonuclease MutS2 [Dehalococcoidia bacterium]